MSVMAEKIKYSLLEAGENEEENKEGSEENAQPEDSADDEDLMSDEPFVGLDLRYAKCFGYSVPEQKNWKFLADQADDLGWKNIDFKQLEKNLTKDVEASYMNIAYFKLTNVDDETDYVLSFDNNKSLWNLHIAHSPKAELNVKERADFFKSKIFKKIAQRTYDRILSAKQTYDKIVKQHLENGELLLVDVVKLDAILSFIDTEHFMDNLLNGKYLSY